MQYNPKSETKQIYLGIEVLRMILSFLIVFVHCFKKKYAKSKLLIIPFYCLIFYVPTFFIISFYFSYKAFSSRNIIKIKERFLRILIPYIIWPIIFWLRFEIMIYLKGIKDENKFKNLYYQMLIGDGFHGVFWFQFNLIMFSLLFTIIIFLFKKKNLFIIQILGILMLIFNFGGYINVFKKFKHPVNHSIKPIPSTLIYSIIGFFLGKLIILDKLKKHRLKTIIIFLPTIYIIRIYPDLFIIINNFKIIIIIYVIINLFFFFAILPFDKINNKMIVIIIKQITSYTGGVYYIHPEIRYIVKKKTFIGCMKNYLICYSICFIGSKLLKNYKLKYLFI